MEKVRADKQVRGMKDVEITALLERADPMRKIFAAGRVNPPEDFFAAFGHLSINDAFAAADFLQVLSAYMVNIAAYFEEYGRIPPDGASCVRARCPFEVAALRMAKKNIEAAIEGGFDAMPLASSQVH